MVGHRIHPKARTTLTNRKEAKPPQVSRNPFCHLALALVDLEVFLILHLFFLELSRWYDPLK